MLPRNEKKCPIDSGKLTSIGQFFLGGGGPIDLKPPRGLKVCKKCGQPFEISE
jgi:hypothetical protein